MNARFVSTLIASSLLLASSAAAAGPSRQDLHEARKLARAAKVLAKEGEHRQAAKSYREADELIPAPSYKLGWARALVEAGELIEAAEVLSACVDTTPRQWVEKKARKSCVELAEEVDDRTPTLEITLPQPWPMELAVTVDGEDHDLDDGAVEYNPGTLEIWAEAPGYEELERTVTLGEGDVESVELTMTKLPTPVVEEEDDDGGISPVPAYLSWAVGVAGLGVGAGFGIAAISTTNDVVTAYGCQGGDCPREAQGDIATAQLNGDVSTVGFAVGGAGVLLGTILYLVSDDEDEEEEGVDEELARRSDRIRLEPATDSGTMGVRLTF